MLYTKFIGHWPAGFGEEFFLRVFTIYGHGSHLGHVTRIIWTNFRSPIQLRLHKKFGPAVPEEKMFEECGRQTMVDRRRWTDDNGACLYYKLTNRPKCSGELISNITQNFQINIFLKETSMTKGKKNNNERTELTPCARISTWSFTFTPPMISNSLKIKCLQKY